jgi:hypothetical protein
MVPLRKLTTRTVKMVACIAITFMCQSPSAHASSLVFQGLNVGFFPTANPNSIGVLMNSVSTTNSPSSMSAYGMSGLDTSALIQSALITQLTNEMYKQIFSGGGGIFNIGGGSTVTYVTNPDHSVTITITNPTSGSTTITIPYPTTGSGGV